MAMFEQNLITILKLLFENKYVLHMDWAYYIERDADTEFV